MPKELQNEVSMSTHAAGVLGKQVVCVCVLEAERERDDIYIYYIYT